MEEKELKALVSLLDEEDESILGHVEQKIRSLGDRIIPVLEKEWERNLNPVVQERIENIIHSLQFENLKIKLTEWSEEEEPELLDGLFLVAKYQYPDLEYQLLTDKLNDIYLDTWLLFKDNMHYYDQIRTLNSIFFNKYKFSGNTKNFHSPTNSFINAVLESGKGNPILLCSIYMIVANRLNIPLYGVNLPNLFILMYKNKQTEFYINVFNRGLIFREEDIDNYLENIHVPKKPEYYQPCTNKDIIKRVLRNLIMAFESLEDHEKTEEVRELLQIFMPLPGL
ncbi:transglutaminase-like domain-containing protein [Mangrovivirga sp. M17]|uniref:Transglutaminase-like domain-containing protein n=1 Tax=Mangrovivirga halotolerans TaxID=2993936 RepID=A0ABT3RTS3_9BACT|nr:transglutaminase-like domain-containing protein [Mangrovivirga halotolerans]MCX2744993.1 transglutaminase-like domain-containing protein [Mangrovivirga halotolerans]